MAERIGQFIQELFPEPEMRLILLVVLVVVFVKFCVWFDNRSSWRFYQEERKEFWGKINRGETPERCPQYISPQGSVQTDPRDLLAMPQVQARIRSMRVWFEKHQKDPKRYPAPDM